MTLDELWEGYQHFARRADIAEDLQRGLEAFNTYSPVLANEIWLNKYRAADVYAAYCRERKRLDTNYSKEDAAMYKKP